MSVSEFLNFFHTYVSTKIKKGEKNKRTMEKDFDVLDDFDFTDEDEETLRELRGVQDDIKRDPITGRTEKRGATLNKRKLSKHEMDEFFLDY